MQKMVNLTNIATSLRDMRGEERGTDAETCSASAERWRRSRLEQKLF